MRSQPLISDTYRIYAPEMLLSYPRISIDECEILASFWFPLNNQTAGFLSEADITSPATARTDRLSHDPSFSPSLFHLDIGTLPTQSKPFSGNGLPVSTPRVQ